MKVIIVGAHGEAKELINRISSGWSISVIDLDQDKLRNFSTNRQIEKIQGDATSSLVLKKAGLDSTTAVITLTLNDEVNLEVLKIAKTIASKSNLTIKIGKQAFYKQLEMPLGDAYRFTSKMMTLNMASQDAKEGISAFLQKRKPNWKNK